MTSAAYGSDFPEAQHKQVVLKSFGDFSNEVWVVEINMHPVSCFAFNGQHKAAVTFAYLFHEDRKVGRCSNR